MVDAVGSALPAVKGRRWDPFCDAVFAFTCPPAVFFNETVVWPAGKGEVVNVGQSTGGPVFFGVMNLTTVTGHRAAWMAAPAVGGVQHNPLRWGGQAAVAALVQLAASGLVEQQQIVIAVS